MMNTGLSFSPTDDANDPNKPKGSANPVQDAIQLLSFRLPSFLGAASPSPLVGSGQSALGSQVGGGVVQEWLKRFFGGQGDDTRTLPGGTGPVSTNPNPVVGYPAPGPQRFTPPPTPAPYTPAPTEPRPSYRSGGTWQDTRDPFRGGGRNQ